MKRNVFFWFMVFWAFFAHAQQDLSVNYANTITAEDMQDHLHILASDALEGRETGTRGQKMAAAYIRYAFEQDGLQPVVPGPAGNTYYQTFALERLQAGKTWLQVGDQKYEQYNEFAYTGFDNFNEPIRSRPVFAGTGREEDFKAIPVKEKDVVIYCSGDRVARRAIAQRATSHGAKHVFLIYKNDAASFSQILRYAKMGMSYGRMSFPEESGEQQNGYFLLSFDLGLKLLNTNEKSLQKAIDASLKNNFAASIKIKPSEITYYSDQQLETVTTENVLGMLEGTDKKDEYVFVTAHYDHIGTRNGIVNNGADDDGSGTVSVLEIAQAFATAAKQGHRPRRSIIFMTVAGEEKGLLGSTYYVDHPVVPLKSTVTDLNIDMIGRVDPQHTDNENYVYVIGADKLSSDLNDISESANRNYAQLDLDYTYNDESDPNRFYYRSDHYNFAKNNIPIIFYFNGTHADYHKPTDTIEKINFDLMAKRARLVFHTAWEVANREQRITLNADKQNSPSGSTK